MLQWQSKTTSLQTTLTDRVRNLKQRLAGAKRNSLATDAKELLMWLGLFAKQQTREEMKCRLDAAQTRTEHAEREILCVDGLK